MASTQISYYNGSVGQPPIYVLNDYDLAAGTYVIDTFLGTCGSGDCSSGTYSGTDPQYQTLFTPVSATPLPAAMPLFATGLGLVGMFGWRRRRKVGAATA